MSCEDISNQEKTDRGRETRERILNAAIHVFSEKGYHDASVSDVAHRAGVAVGTVYVHFENKNDLYKCMLERCNEIIQRRLATAAATGKTPREAAEAGMREWLHLNRNYGWGYRLLLEALFVDERLFENFYESLSRAQRGWLERARQAGTLRDDIDSDVLSWMLLGAATFLGLKQNLEKEPTDDLEQAAASYIQIVAENIFVENSAEEPTLRMQSNCSERSKLCTNSRN